MNQPENALSEVSSIKFAAESHEKAELGKPGKFLKYKKVFLFIFAILAAGLIELLIIILFSRI